MATYLFITTLSERDRVMADLDQFYGYPKPETGTLHAAMWTAADPEAPDDGPWIIPVYDTAIYSHVAGAGVDIVDAFGQVVPDAGVTRENDPETGEPLIPMSLANQQTNAATMVNPVTGEPEFVRKSWWITYDDAVAQGFFPTDITDGGGGPIKGR